MARSATSSAGFIGYLERENRREADKLLRQTIAQRYEEQWDRISQLQRQLISEGKLELVDDLEAAAIKLRAFIDRARHASYGYSGFFDAVRVNEAELTRIYEYDSDPAGERQEDLRRGRQRERFAWEPTACRPPSATWCR